MAAMVWYYNNYDDWQMAFLKEVPIDIEVRFICHRSDIFVFNKMENVTNEWHKNLEENSSNSFVELHKLIF